MAKAICTGAIARGSSIDVFSYERSIEISHDIEEVLREAIEDCDEVVVLLTPDSICSAWVLAEIGAAWAFKKPIAAVTYYVDVEATLDVIRTKQTIELGDFDRYIEQVVQRAARRRTS